ncbi:MAG TPA: ATP-binding protein [Methylocystis sp.]|nr:ATP-binding protein [Methylocystis sp.]
MGTERGALVILKSLTWVWREPEDPILASRLRAERFAFVARYTPWLLLANVGNALAMLVAYWETPQFWRAFGWAAAVAVLSAYIYVARLLRAARATGSAKSTAGRRVCVNAILLGGCWAALPLFFFRDASHGEQLLIVCLSAGMMSGGIFVLAALPLAALLFSGPIAGASFVTLVSSGEKHDLLMATVLIFYTLVLLRGALVHAHQLLARVMAQVETEEKARARVRKLQATGLHAIGGMASTLVHEVNQPLTAATAYLHSTLALLRAPPERRIAEPVETLEKALQEVSRAGQIVSHLRDFILKGEPDLRFLRLHPLIEKASREAGPTACQAGATIDLRLAAEHDLVLGDQVQLNQVLANLIRNALDAVSERPERKVFLSTATNGEGEIETEVSDTGPGVSPSIGAELFSPFMTTKELGMGVGLAISRSIVEAHHGRIWAEPRPGGGARFCFSLPLVEEEAEAG